MRHILLILLLLFSLTQPALADCTGPAGAESATRYDFTAHKLFYCNGTSWVEIGGAAGTGEAAPGSWCGLRIAKCSSTSVSYETTGSSRITQFPCNGTTITAACLGSRVTQINCPAGYTGAKIGFYAVTDQTYYGMELSGNIPTVLSCYKTP